MPFEWLSTYSKELPGLPSFNVLNVLNNVSQQSMYLLAPGSLEKLQDIKIFVNPTALNQESRCKNDIFKTDAALSHGWTTCT